MKQPSIVLDKVRLEQAKDKTIAAFYTMPKGGVIVIPIPAAQLQRWVLRQIRAEVAG